MDDKQAAADAIARMDRDQGDIAFGARGRARGDLRRSALVFAGAAAAAGLAVVGGGVGQAGLGAAALAGAVASTYLARAGKGASEVRAARGMQSYLASLQSRDLVAPTSLAGPLRKYEVEYTAARASRAGVRASAVASGAHAIAALAMAAGAALGAGGPIGLALLGGGALVSAYRSFTAARTMRSAFAEARSAAQQERHWRGRTELFARGAAEMPHTLPSERTPTTTAPAAEFTALPGTGPARSAADGLRTAWKTGIRNARTRRGHSARESRRNGRGQQ